MTALEAVSEEFKFYGFDQMEDSVLKNVASFIKTTRADTDEVVSDLVAFVGNQQDKSVLTDQLFNEYKAGLVHKKKPAGNNINPTPPRHELAVKSDHDFNIIAAYGGSPATPVQPTKRVQSTPDNPSNKRRSDVYGTPQPTNQHSDTKITPRRDSLTPSSKKYTRRTNKAEVVFSHGNTKAVTVWKGSRNDVDVSIVGAGKTNEKFRYMFQKLQDRAYVLDRRIVELSESIRQVHLPDLDEFTNVVEKTVSDVFVSGQICCDCEGRLNTESVVLQGCMGVSNGRAVPVSLSDLSKYSMFPGQPAALPTTLIHECDGVSLMVACGPFTPNNTNNYEPLHDLLKEVGKSPPDVLILMGPFLDHENHVLQHSVEAFGTIFHSTLDDIISQTISKHPSMQVVIVSSPKDLHHEPIYPTPEYQVHSDRKSPSVHYVMNPATILVDGVRIGLTATDVLFQMAANEISWDANMKDRMLRLSEHLLSQRSYFPVYPPNTDINLDLELNETHGAMSSSPHILLLSSNFNQFVKVGEKTVFANPGRLCKGEGGGTYMRMIIEPLSNIDHVTRNVTAEIIRI